MSINFLVKLAVLMPAACILYCAVSPVGKGGTDTGNPILCGKLVEIDGKPAAGAIVNMVPVDYFPSFALLKASLPRSVACTTNCNGEYRIYSLDSLDYTFEACLETNGVFRDSIKVVLDSQEHRLDNMTLTSLGRVFGVTKMPGQNDTNQIRVTLYIPGTRRITKPSIGGAFMFDLVPAGSYHLIIDPTLNTYDVKVLDIHLNPGQHLDLDTLLLNMNSAMPVSPGSVP